MIRQMSEKLNKKYPELLDEMYFECDDGWYNILDTLLWQIQEHQRRTSPSAEEIVKVQQIKEKYAGLRFYYYGGDDYIRGLVDMAEATSLHTCEFCGQAGKQMGKGWLKTSCYECHRRRQEKDERVKENNSFRQSE